MKKLLNMDLGNIQVAKDIVFTGEESALLAHLVAKRFAYDYTLAASKWRGMFQNSCNDFQFKKLAELGKIVADNLGWL